MRHREPFADRGDAGEQLARAVVGLRLGEPVVLALPRGGVPVAAPVAGALGAPLDVLVVRKLGLPWHPELAMGALAGAGGEVVLVLDGAVLSRSCVAQDEVAEVRAREEHELRRRESAYRAGRPPVPLAGRAAVLVDDGLATGSTMLAAVRAVRRLAPRRVVVAVPTGAREAVERLAREADEVLCLRTPQPFVAVGYAYRDFAQTTDDEVRTALGAR